MGFCRCLGSLFFPDFTCHGAIEVTRHFHFIEKHLRRLSILWSFNPKTVHHFSTPPCSCCKSAWCPPWPPKTQGASTRPEKRASQGANLPKRIRSLCTCCRVMLFSHVTWLTQADATINQTEELPPKPLRLASFITELVLELYPEFDLRDGFVDLHGPFQGLAAE